MGLFYAMLSNISILAFLGLVLFRAMLLLRQRGRWLQRGYLVASSAFLSILITNYPLLTSPGARYDLRGVPILIAGFFGGPIAGVVSGSVAAIYRYYLGGPWAMYGAIDLLIDGAASGLLSAWVVGDRYTTVPRWYILIANTIAAAISISYQLLIVPHALLMGHLGNLIPMLLIYQPLSALVLTEILQRELLAIQHHEQLRMRATRDAKTSLLNSAAFDHELSEWLNNGTSPVSVLFIDVNEFKQVNDRYGHEVGDQVLRELAHRLLDSVRSGDQVARYGGDEFVIGLPTCDYAAALCVADQIRRAISASPFCCGADIYLSVAIGVSTNEFDPTLSARQLLERADEAMYAAKRAKHGKAVGHQGLLGETR